MLRDSPIVTTIPVESLESSRDFYERVLGLEPHPETAPAGGVFYECGDRTRVYVYESRVRRGEQTVAGFIVDDLEKEMSDLRAKGVTFEEYDLPGVRTEHGIAKDPTGSRSCWFKDPDGNILALTEIKAEAIAA